MGGLAHLFLFGLILNKLLLLLQDLQSLLVGSSLGCIELGFIDLLVSLRDFWMDLLAYQVLGKTAESSDQRVHDIISLLLKVECSTENQQDTRYTVDIVQFDPGHEFLPETSWRNTRESDTSRLTSGLELFGGERFSTFGVDHLLISFHDSWEYGLAHHVINPDSLELASDLVFENIVGTESVYTNVIYTWKQVEVDSSYPA